MRFYEFKTIKPLTPQQSRINSLKQQKERANTQLKAERDKQKKQKAIDTVRKNNEILGKLNIS